ncbi:MAG: putative membrane protein [Candidatus Latescibacterota bacterium]|jgi:protoporphyrinogen IX oxidase
MSEALLAYYFLLKALHITAIISWMVGLLYLPHIYVSHSRVAADSAAAEHFASMERRLLRSAMNPAMALAFITGILLIIATKVGAPGTGYWIHAKLLLILLLGAAHGIMSSSRKRLERGENEKSEGFFLTLARASALFMVLIVFLVVMKPF